MVYQLLEKLVTSDGGKKKIFSEFELKIMKGFPKIA